MIRRKASCACGGSCPNCQVKNSDLPVSQPHDTSEIEADRIADEVMRMPGKQPVSGYTAAAGKVLSGRVNPAVQSKSKNKVSENKRLPGEINASAGSGRAMNGGIRSFMEDRFGTDFSGVRIHDDSNAVNLSSEFNADAFTIGRNIFFNKGKYAPETDSGKRLLAHELTHTIQQNSTSASYAFPAAFIQRQPKSKLCTDLEVETLNKEMHKQCDKPRSCSMQGDSCLTATQKVSTGNSCVRQRTELQQKCYRPGDPKYEPHMKMLANDSTALRNCIEIMIAKCAAEAAAAAALAAAALALKNAAQKAMKSAAGRAFIYAQVGAAVVLLISGKAEAKISMDGDSPLEALYKAIEQDGVAVPDDMKKMIENDPELKKMIEDSAKNGGNLSDVQKEMARKYSEYLSQHINEFSKEELESLLNTTGKVAENMPSDLNVDKIKKSLEGKTGKGDGQGSGASESTDKPTAKTEGEKPQDATRGETPKPAAEDPKYSYLNEESKKKINEALPPVLELFRQFTSGEGGKAKLDDAAVKRFFEAVPVDLTKEQSETLITRISPNKDKTADELFEALKKGVEEVRKPVAADEGETSANNSSSKTAAQDAEGKTKQQIISELQEIAKNADFKNVPEAQIRIRSLNKTVKDGKLSSHVLGKQNGVGLVAYITAELVPPTLDINKLKTGDSFEIKIVSLSPFVDKDGKSYDLPVTKTIRITK